MENERVGPVFTVPFYSEASDGANNMMKDSRTWFDEARHTSRQDDAFEAVFAFDFANLQSGSRLFVIDSISEVSGG